jgi:hypothetical protein
MITATGANPGQFNQSLEYLRLVNSPSRDDRQQALQMMQAEISVLARSLGIPVPGVNMLEGHADLIQAVGQGQISPQHANEIAAGRERAKLEANGSAQRAQQTQQDRATAQETAQAKQELNQLGAYLHKTDPNYKAKYDTLVPVLQPIFAKLPPREWAAAFKEAYSKLPAPVAPRATTPTLPPVASPANGGGNTPLRASNPAGGSPRPAPRNMAEAIDFGLQDAR